MGWPGSLKVALVLTFVSLFFLVVGFVLPWWFAINKTVYMSVFYAVVCPASEGITSGKCAVINLLNVVTNQIDNNGSGDQLAASIFYLLLQAVSSTAVGLCFFSCLILIIHACADTKNKCGYGFAAFLLLLSAITSILVVAFFAFLYVTIYTVACNTGSCGIDAENFPYSVLSFGIGSFISFIAFVLLCIAMCTWRNYDDDDSDDGRNFPMTDKRQGYNGYDNPRFMDDGRNRNQSGYDYPHSNQRSYEYDSRDRYYHGNSKYDQSDRNGYPYRQDNMYRPMNTKY